MRDGRNGINGRKLVWSAVFVVISLTGGAFVTYSLGGDHTKVLYHYIFADFNIDKLRSAIFLINNLNTTTPNSLQIASL